MDPATKRIRMIFFVWSDEEKSTEKVEERVLILPNEIEVKKEKYKSKEVRRKLAENLMAKLFSKDYASPKHIDTLANSRISQVSNYYFKQIIVKMDSILVVNTVEHGVIYFDLENIGKEKQQLEMSDSKKAPQLEEGYSVSYLMDNGEHYFFMSQNESINKW